MEQDLINLDSLIRKVDLDQKNKSANDRLDESLGMKEMEKNLQKLKVTNLEETNLEALVNKCRIPEE